MPDKMSQEKIALLRAYGAEVVITPDRGRPASRPSRYYRVADRLTEEIPGAFQPNQYFNPENPDDPLRDDRPGDLGADRRHGSTSSSPASAPAARSPAWAATSRSRTPTSRSSAPTPRGRSTRATSLARTSSRASARTSGRGRSIPTVVDRYVRVSRSRLVPHGPRRDAAGGHPGRRLVRVGASSPRSRWRASSTRRRRSSCCCPTPVASTCRRSTPTRGCCSTACSTGPR